MITYKLSRWFLSDKGIISDFYCGDELLCFALEAPKPTAIPEGTYKLAWEMSPRLGVFTPRLLDVPGRDGILIHAGNLITDTEGCILVGTGWAIDKDHVITLENSRVARDRVYKMMEADLDHGYAEIDVQQEGKP